MGELLFAVILAFVFGFAGYFEGVKVGKDELCHAQFQGEMRNNKCVRISLEEIK